MPDRMIREGPDDQLHAPSDEEAERRVLGCMARNRQALEQAADRLTADEFYWPEHRRAFRALARLGPGLRSEVVVTGREVRTVVVGLDQAIAATGGRPFDADLVAACMADSGPEVIVGQWIDRVLAAAGARRLMNACARVHNALGRWPVYDPETLADLRRCLGEVTL